VTIHAQRSVAVGAIALAVLVDLAPTATACPAEPISPGRRVVFLGDSITYGGHWVAALEAALRARDPEARFDFLALGLPSETVSGLSEPDHPFPRPDVHERLARTLTKTKPATVVACYGVNDGIYHPFDEARFLAYQRGIERLVVAVREAGAELVLITPPPFDPEPMRRAGKLREAGSKQFAWFAIYARYDDEVMARYADWIRRFAGTAGVACVVDVRAPLLEHVARRRKAKPDFALSADGIHLDAEGNRVIAAAVLRALDARASATEARRDAGFGAIDDLSRVPELARHPTLVTLVEKRQNLLRDAWLSEIGHQRPGIEPGPPLAEAERRASEIGAEIRALLAKPADATR